MTADSPATAPHAGSQASLPPARSGAEDAASGQSRKSSSSLHSNPPSQLSLAHSAVDFAKQAEKLSHQHPEDGKANDVAVEARFVTPQDPVVVTSEGHRLPGVPLDEAHKLNVLKEELSRDSESGPEAAAAAAAATADADAAEQSEKCRDHREDQSGQPLDDQPDQSLDQHRQSDKAGGPAQTHDATLTVSSKKTGQNIQKKTDGSLRRTMPPSNTNPLFPPLPLYGPPSLLRDIQCLAFRVSSFFLSLAFLGVIVLGALFCNIPSIIRSIWKRATFRDPSANRRFYDEENRRRARRKEQDQSWKRQRSQDRRPVDREGRVHDEGFVRTEGGPDPVVCDVGYYARRVGLDVETFHVQTEDGFIIELWHVYDPREYTRMRPEDREDHGPDLFSGPSKMPKDKSAKRKFPVLLMHGLLQSSGAYCCNDDDSLAFYLCKSGYDVWLGNNRCGFHPRHVLLDYADPRMWCWNIRQMGVFDLPALTSRVLVETEFEKIGLICHSQGTTETFVALAKQQRPDLGEKLTVFCALAPAAYAGPLIGKMYFKFMRLITPGMFRLIFGIHAFIPLMMDMHGILHPGLYGWLGYTVFSFLFDWTDDRWERDLRARMFQFAPVYVSAESMRWWLGRECFAKHKCILSTKEEWRAEEREDMEANEHSNLGGPGQPVSKKEQQEMVEAENKQLEQAAERTGEPVNLEQDDETANMSGAGSGTPRQTNKNTRQHQHRQGKHHHHRPGVKAWYDERAPPFALWVCGRDDLVDGDKLLRRFDRGREPHVDVVHKKVIEGYEHLDVIWAMDAPEQVFCEIREVLWKTCDVRDRCRVPTGCEDVAEWKRPEKRSKDEAGGLDNSQSPGSGDDDDSEDDSDDDDDEGQPFMSKF